jgi:hypothetical protein
MFNDDGSFLCGSRRNSRGARRGPQGIVNDVACRRSSACPGSGEHRIFRLRQSQQLAHQGAQRTKLGNDLLGWHRCRQVCNLEPQDGERRAQFMRHVAVNCF